MFEKFTDRARKVVVLANQEAQRLNHAYIGTEHLLLGLVKEGSGVAAAVLKSLGADLGKIREEVGKLVEEGLPNTVASGLRLPQTPRAKKSLTYAIEEAGLLNHNYVGTEHILLGLIREYDGVAAHVILAMGLTAERVREEVLRLLGAGTEQDDGVVKMTIHVNESADISSYEPRYLLRRPQSESEKYAHFVWVEDGLLAGITITGTEEYERIGTLVWTNDPAKAKSFTAEEVCEIKHLLNAGGQDAQSVFVIRDSRKNRPASPKKPTADIKEHGTGLPDLWPIPREVPGWVGPYSRSTELLQEQLVRMLFSDAPVNPPSQPTTRWTARVRIPGINATVHQTHAESVDALSSAIRKYAADYPLQTIEVLRT